ncbi:unnamed protein product [Pedinophyceae sp. YPF-701]|nr:unnamed protein product [Pedinophyceae sp. YPF-701]
MPLSSHRGCRKLSVRAEPIEGPDDRFYYFRQPAPKDLGDGDAGQVTHFFTPDGVFSIKDRRSPRREPRAAPPLRPAGHEALASRDGLADAPLDSLLLGATFNLQATNGLDVGRRLQYQGFCRCVESLYDAVSLAVARRGGEVVLARTEVRPGTLSEQLQMTVAVPQLWFASRTSRCLKEAILEGGGLVDRVQSHYFIA